MCVCCVCVVCTSSLSLMVSLLWSFFMFGEVFAVPPIAAVWCWVSGLHWCHVVAACCCWLLLPCVSCVLLARVVIVVSRHLTALPCKLLSRVLECASQCSPRHVRMTLLLESTHSEAAKHIDWRLTYTSRYCCLVARIGSLEMKLVSMKREC